MAGTRPRRRLEIYVAPGCPASDVARRLAETVGGYGLPGVDVRLIDLSDPGATKPVAVFAVPTYLLDGRVLCLGNPGAAWLIARLRAGAGEERGPAATDDGR